MYVCLCHAVTDKHIEQAIAEGARCIKELRSKLKVTSKCGRCIDCTKSCLNASINAKAVNKQQLIAEAS